MKTTLILALAALLTPALPMLSAVPAKPAAVHATNEAFHAPPAGTNPLSARPPGTAAEGEPMVRPSPTPASLPAAIHGSPKAPSAVRSSWYNGIRSTLAKVPRTACCCAALLAGLFYTLLVRIFAVRALLKRLRAEERLAAAGIHGDVPLHHPALLAIRKWSESPASPPDRPYRWLDGRIAAVFGSLISQGEGLRTLSLNCSFGATIVAFVIATTGGHDIDRMLSEVSGALGATLLGLVLFTLESSTLAKLNAEAVRLEFEGREMIDLWGTERSAPTTKSRRPDADVSTATDQEETYANAT